jgi:ribosomal protein L37AE/L43A
LAFYEAHKLEVPEPCLACGGEVFHRAGPGSPWRCRTCEPAMGKVAWLVID